MTFLQKEVRLAHRLLTISLLLLFSGCGKIVEARMGEIRFEHLIINDTVLDIKDYAGFGPIKSGDSITIFAQRGYYGGPRKNCCMGYNSEFLLNEVFTHTDPRVTSVNTTADITFDVPSCVYFGINEGHYNYASYEVMPLSPVEHFRLTYRVTSRVFLQVEACR